MRGRELQLPPNPKGRLSSEQPGRCLVMLELSVKMEHYCYISSEGKPSWLKSIFLVYSAQTLLLSTVSLSFPFFPTLRLDGKDISGQPATEAPTLWVPEQQASPSGTCTAGWCICCDPPGTDKALTFSKHWSNPLLPKSSQVPALKDFSTASPSAHQSACVTVRQIWRAEFNALSCDSAS